jgi:hypothetical protein
MRSRFPFRSSVFVLSVVCLAALAFVTAPARERTGPLPGEGGRDPLGILVLDGSGVHDVGELLLNTENWGAFGSYPGANTPISQYPSAEWPAGSGIEHLNIAGLWVGAEKGCVLGERTIAVSTAAYEMEFRPTDSPIDRIYETYEGAPGGNRVPSPYADDDGDGSIDEDYLDGHDNDDDGLIDEDFAAISQQMFSSWFTDDQPEAIAQYPEHDPLHLTVRQESYQWTDPRFDDFVGASFFMTNTGDECLDHVYVGMFLDFDAGRRDEPDYWADDLIGYWEGIRCTELGPASLHVAYVCDAVDGVPRSYCGAMLLGHTVYAEGGGVGEVGVNAVRIFSGDLPYENGGDPTNDFQRYELMSTPRIDLNPTAPRDYRVLMSSGQFSLLAGESIEYHIGFVCGATFEEMLDNAAMCQKLFDGLWLNLDGNPLTGVEGRETIVEGPATGVVIDSCRADLSDPIALARGEHVWINTDCSREEFLKEACGYTEADSLLFRTGVDGREGHVSWMYGQPQGIMADLDIRPGSCPNPFNVKLFEFLEGGNPHAGGVLPVAIPGDAAFDVHDIDLATVRLEGVEPLATGRGYEDVTSPLYGPDPCECGGTGPDGYEDLVLKFNAQQIAAALPHYDLPEVGEGATLVLRGNLENGIPFEASDCIVYVGPPKADRGDRDMLAARETRLFDTSPNPFNPATTIRFDLAAPGHVTLAVYDVAGRLVSVLVDGEMPAGSHEAVWDGRGAGGAAAASGVYFYKLAAPEFSETRKMVLLR